MHCGMVECSDGALRIFSISVFRFNIQTLSNGKFSCLLCPFTVREAGSRVAENGLSEFEITSFVPQKAVFCNAESGLLRCKRPSFAV